MSRRRFFRNQEGVAALEFGLLAPLFFTLLIVLIDLSIFFATHSIVDDAVETASRAVRLGVLHSDKDGTKFRDKLCSRLFFVKCENFSFSVKATSDLASISAKPAIDKDGKIQGAIFDPGHPNDLVVITIVYVHKFIIPYVGVVFGDDGLNDPQQRAITSFIVIKNEPYPE